MSAGARRWDRKMIQVPVPIYTRLSAMADRASDAKGRAVSLAEIIESLIDEHDKGVGNVR